MSEDDDMLQLRSRLLEGGRAEVGGILSDITSKYNAAVYHRDVEIGNLRRFISSLEQRLQDERDGRLQERVADRAAHQSTAAEVEELRRAVAERDDQLRVLTANERSLASSLSELKAKYVVLKRASKETSALLQQASQGVDRLTTEAERLSSELSSAQTDAFRERKRADQFYRALKDAEGDASSLAAKINLVHKESGEKAAHDHTLKEALTLQLSNTKRLLHIMKYMGSQSHGTGAEIADAVQVLGSRFQYVPTSLESGPHAGIAQDLKGVVEDYERGSRLTGRLEDDGDTFRHLHIEVDRWVPEETVSTVRRFHARYFPRSSPKLFYSLLTEVASQLRSLSNMSPFHQLTKAAHKEGKRVSSKYGLHDNRFNAPQQLVGAAPSLDYFKESGPRSSNGEYFYAAKPISHALPSAADICLKEAVSKAWEGLKLLQRQLSTSGDRTAVSLQLSTVENICTLCSKAMEEMFARLNGNLLEGTVAAPPQHLADGSGLSMCSQLLSLFQGVRDAVSHCDDKLAAVIADVESQRCTLHSKSSSAEYTLLKHQVRQTVDRYHNELTTMIQAAHTTVLQLRAGFR